LFDVTLRKIASRIIGSWPGTPRWENQLVARYCILNLLLAAAIEDWRCLTGKSPFARIGARLPDNGVGPREFRQWNQLIRN
jgi:hypothetical protein